jgi:hypothetical protein
MFEKNEFEKKFKRKRKTFSLSLSFLPAGPTSLSAQRPFAFFFARAVSPAAQPALPPAQHRAPLPFLFALVTDRWGPAVRPFPNL